MAAAGVAPAQTPTEELEAPVLSLSACKVCYVAWKPGQRKAQRALESPYEGVPPHLVGPLWNWLSGAFTYPLGDESRLREVFLYLRLPAESSTNRHLGYLASRCREDQEFMLDLVEALLELYGWDGWRGDDLQKLLESANSAYQVSEDMSGLEEVVALGVKDLVAEVVGAAHGTAGDHLSTAWNAAYGRKADPVKAYSEAIKAVEAALVPRVSPKNARQTLGTMIRDIAAKPSKWKFVIPDGTAQGVESVLQMMRILWDGQAVRHGNHAPTPSQTLEEARAAVHIAATLVQFGVSGAFDLFESE